MARHVLADPRYPNAGQGPVSYSYEVRVERAIPIGDLYLPVFHSLWREVHTKREPTVEWFNDWVRRIPNIQCGCLLWLLEYLKSNPERYDDWFVWSWELHNAINTKLGKPLVTLEEARKIWDD